MVAFQHISLWKFKADTEKDVKEACLQKLKKVSKPGVLRINVGEVLEGENETPDEHLGIWFGETSKSGNPKYRTVPIEYCEKIENIDNYH